MQRQGWGVASKTLCIKSAAARSSIQTRPSRLFSSSVPVSGLFKDYVKNLESSGTVKEITPAELSAKLTADPVHGAAKTFHLIDVREPYEWNEEHISGATYIGKGVLERDIEGVVPDVYDEVVVYCAGGLRSVIAADSLQKLGYKNVATLQGGIGNFKTQGFNIQQNFAMYSDKGKH
ncbi:hypothetical protein SmJEL517_g02051 [Synchytrium microbalum]|uniref:Rhodanese domain-containing protein n=1 Tax=Synchytrium microbalum TaxID=1806994 RepID=A0A507C8J7_9FUNG|nr:uncharacterized protein SmJEL517_g02051 [Synchytrium microbalum]TPX35469.1 hypothetical protein SmJEL517_g02051 [Synchytrium microbalum]